MSDTQNMEQAQEVQHSPKFEDIKGYHDSGFWNAAMVKMLSRKENHSRRIYGDYRKGIPVRGGKSRCFAEVHLA